MIDDEIVAVAQTSMKLYRLGYNDALNDIKEKIHDIILNYKQISPNGQLNYLLDKLKNMKME